MKPKNPIIKRGIFKINVGLGDWGTGGLGYWVTG